MGREWREVIGMGRIEREGEGEVDGMGNGVVRKTR